MRVRFSTITCYIRILLLCFAASGTGIFAANASNGYISPGYGPISRQMAGATTALAGDAFAGSSNPAKLLAAGNRTDVGVEFFMPWRKVERTGSGTPYDFSSESENWIFLIPEAAISRRINEKLAWGITVYGNGGLNTEFRDTTGVPGSNLNPAMCGAEPGNFLGGCGKLGFDLMQLVVAPGVAYQALPGHTFGIAPLLAAQRFQAYGLQAVAAFSQSPGDVTNRDVDTVFGAGARIGWLGQITPALTLGAAYATRIAMQEFDKYDGLFAEGRFDVPENFNAGLAFKLTQSLTTTLDYQHIKYSQVKSLSNGVLNSFLSPPDNPLGSETGSGFNWDDTNTYRVGVAFAVKPTLSLRGGYAYGKRPNDTDVNSMTLNLLAPNPLHQASVGFSWSPKPGQEFHMAYTSFVPGKYSGPSALFPGATESIDPYVNAVMVAWSWKH